MNRNNTYKKNYLYLCCEFETHKIDMKHKTLSTRSAEFLNYLIHEDKQCFTLEFAYNILKKQEQRHY